jgi:beta-alanine degradation protein BauB
MTPSTALTFESWPDWLRDDLAANGQNGWVGQILVSETDRVRIWSLRLAPGERIGFHRHVLDYFWTVLTDGKARSHFGDGHITETSYLAGDTKHMRYAKGEFMIHDLENIGTTELIFTTVEFVECENKPLPVPAHMRRAA